jgi:hypothetical protein
VLAVVAASLALTSCDTDAPFAPPLPSAAGYRDDGGTLRIWTGTPCAGVTRIALTFTTAEGERQRLVLTAPSPGVTIESLDVAHPDHAFTVTERPMAGFDWRDAERISLVIDADEPAWGSVVDVDEVVTGSPEHKSDTYLFDDLGWKDRADVAEANGISFLTVCTPGAGPPASTR